MGNPWFSFRDGDLGSNWNTQPTPAKGNPRSTEKIRMSIV